MARRRLGCASRSLCDRSQICTIIVQMEMQVSFRNLGYSAAIASAVRERAAKLEKFYPRITSLRVIIEPSERRHHQGNLYHVRVDMTLPGHEIIVRRDPAEHHAHEDIYVAIRDAFDATRRQLEDYVRRRFRGRKRHHEEPMHGLVTRIFPNEDCGFLSSVDGREVYFHRNSVLAGEFDSLQVGDEVCFSETLGEKGPQASTVQAIGKHGRHAKIA